MRKTIALVAFAVVCASGLMAQGPPNNGKEVTVIRGKVMGFASVSPALTKELQAKQQGKKPEAPPKGPHAFVGQHGFAYVSPHAEGKKKQ